MKDKAQCPVCDANVEIIGKITHSYRNLDTEKIKELEEKLKSAKDVIFYTNDSCGIGVDTCLSHDIIKRNNYGEIIGMVGVRAKDWLKENSEEKNHNNNCGMTHAC